MQTHPKGKKFRARYLNSTPRLVELALKAGEKCKKRLVRWPNASDWPVKFHDPISIPGVIGTADQINSDPEVIKLICDRYRIDIEECEGAAVAQVCMAYNIPFLIIRGISDNELICPAYGEYLRTGKGDLGWVEVESTRNAWIVFLEMINMLGYE
jgi:nucleoside phosphorylase